MAFYGVFSSDGMPVAFYADSINGETGIPAAAIPLTDEQWREFVGNPGFRRWNGSRVVNHAPPAPPEPAAITYKADIWRRCTDAQAEALTGLLGTQSVRQQRLFNDSQHLLHDDPDFLVLRAAVGTFLGEAEAARILAPSE
jgi:hypothetical protein